MGRSEKLARRHPLRGHLAVQRQAPSAVWRHSRHCGIDSAWNGAQTLGRGAAICWLRPSNGCSPQPGPPGTASQAPQPDFGGASGHRAHGLVARQHALFVDRRFRGSGLGPGSIRSRRGLGWNRQPSAGWMEPDRFAVPVVLVAAFRALRLDRRAFSRSALEPRITGTASAWHGTPSRPRAERLGVESRPVRGAGIRIASSAWEQVKTAASSAFGSLASSVSSLAHSAFESGKAFMTAVWTASSPP